MIRFVILLILLVGCKTYKPLPVGYSIESAEPYRKMFKKDCEKYRSDCKYVDEFSIVFVRDLAVGWDNANDGYCEILTKTIYIDISAWENKTPTRKLILLYHELGHCALKIPFHRDGLVLREGQEIPKSIMSTTPRTPTREEFEANEEYYKNELFN